MLENLTGMSLKTKLLTLKARTYTLELHWREKHKVKTLNAYVGMR